MHKDQDPDRGKNLNCRPDVTVKLPLQPKRYRLCGRFPAPLPPKLRFPANQRIGVVSCAKKPALPVGRKYSPVPQPSCIQQSQRSPKYPRTCRPSSPPQSATKPVLVASSERSHPAPSRFGFSFGHFASDFAQTFRIAPPWGHGQKGKEGARKEE